MRKWIILMSFVALISTCFGLRASKNDFEEDTEDDEQFGENNRPAYIGIPVYGKYVDVLISEKVPFNESITVSSKSWSEVKPYTRHFHTYRKYTRCSFSYSIPFSGNDAKKAVNRVMVILDDDPVYDATFQAPIGASKVPLAISAHKANFGQGAHCIKIFAAVDSGTLYIPYYSPLSLEGSLYPSIFATLEVYCQR